MMYILCYVFSSISMSIFVAVLTACEAYEQVLDKEMSKSVVWRASRNNGLT